MVLNQALSRQSLPQLRKEFYFQLFCFPESSFNLNVRVGTVLSLFILHINLLWMKHILILKSRVQDQLRYLEFQGALLLS